MLKMANRGKDQYTKTNNAINIARREKHEEYKTRVNNGTHQIHPSQTNHMYGSNTNLDTAIAIAIERSLESHSEEKQINADYLLSVQLSRY